MHKALHTRDDVDRLNVFRKREDDLPALNIASCIDTTTQTLHRKTQRKTDYTRNNTDNTRINRTNITRKQKWEEKQLYGNFKQQTSDISHEENMDVTKKGNLKKESESLLKTAQNNAIRTNYIKAKIDKTQQNSKCGLCDDRDETINHIISKLALKEYKIRHDWVGKVIHWELCKKFRFDHMNKWYTHNSESALGNKTHKPRWYFEKQTDYLISTRRPNLAIVNKKEKKINKKRELVELWTLLSRQTAE